MLAQGKITAFYAKNVLIFKTFFEHFNEVFLVLFFARERLILITNEP